MTPGQVQKDRIVEGDYVAVYTGSQWFYGTVLYIPCATGDAWHIRTENGELVYVQTYEHIELREKPKAVTGDD